MITKKQLKGFQKKILILLGIVAGLLVFFTIRKLTRPCVVPSLISIPVDAKDTKITIGQKIMIRYLGQFKHKNSCVSSWLNDYKVNKIETTSFNQTQENPFVITVSFSVKPHWLSKKSFWVAGNGKEDKDWIIDKFAFVTIEKKDNSYVMQEIGTGP